MADPVGIVILVVLSGAFGLLSRIARKSERPVGFWTGEQPDPAKISDVPAFNRAYARLWRALSAVFLLGIPVCFLLDCSAVLWEAAGVFLGLPLAIVVHTKIRKKYMLT